jgi:hypothetical protein
MSPILANPKSEIRNPRAEGFSLEWDPCLVEEAVLRTAETRLVLGFRGQRNRLYDIQDPERREAAFREFHSDWFERLDLGRGIWRALQEQPLIPTSTRACIVVHSRGSRDEGTELFVSPGREGTEETERRTVAIRLDPQRLLEEEDLLAFLRHELFHIADMLDPAFGYEPRLPRGEIGPAHERLLQDRYRVLWDTYIDGRLVRQGRTPASVRDRRLQEFTRTFPMLADHLEEAYSRFADGTTLSHNDLVGFVIDPGGVAGSAPFPRNPDLPILHQHPRAGQRCPLCGFPTHSFTANPEQLPPEVVARIRADFADWTPIRGLCQQCANLYHS